MDSPGLHLHFDTIQQLSKRPVDLIIFFPDHLDALRNCEYVYQDQPDSNLDRVLGTGADWRSELGHSPRDHWAEILRELYVDQLRHIGYSEFEFERIRRGSHPLYRLIFCSKDRSQMHGQPEDTIACKLRDTGDCAFFFGYAWS